MASSTSTLSEELFPKQTPSETSNTSGTPSTMTTPTTEAGSNTPADPIATPSTSTASTAAIETETTGKPKPKGKCIHKKKKEAEEKEKEKAKKEAEEKEKAEKEERKEKEEKDKKEQEKKDQEKKEKEDKEKKKSKKDKKSKKSGKKGKKSKKSEESSDSSDNENSSDSGESSDSDGSSSSSSTSSSSSDSEVDGDEALAAAIRLILAKSSKSKQRRLKEKKKAKAKKAKKEKKKAKKAEKEAENSTEGEGEKKKDEEEKTEDRASVLEYKRVDELYDKELHDYKICDTVPHPKTDKYSSFIFTVRRVFDYENKYIETQVDIKSPLLKEALAGIIGDVRGVSLVEDVPSVDPNMLFNFLPDFEAWVEKKSKLKGVPEKDPPKPSPSVTGKPIPPPLTAAEVSQQVDQVKLLIDYINTDYAPTKAALFPLLENSMITFDLLWAVLKPGVIMYTTCAGSNEPRAFKLEYAQKESSFMRGKWWALEGKYLEYDGKDGPVEAGDDEGGGFGWGTVSVDIEGFKGARKITSLSCYPLDFRKDKETMRNTLIERGRKFVSLKGMQYKMHNGIAFIRKKRQYVKIHVKGRIMIDPATFRRINPNYVISSIRSRYDDDEEEENNNNGEERGSEEGGECTECCCNGEDDGKTEQEKELERLKVVVDEKGNYLAVTQEQDNLKKMKVERVEEQPEEVEPVFTDEELLTSSPVVLGWAFTEKYWLEFAVSGVEEIQWNDKAFESLVLPDAQKTIVKALVESHTGKNIESATIDDVIQGKGRGLVSVLHGPPGVGKTLTAEGIAELLRKPLYCVSSGELGTNPASLEQELNKILDIAHSWGAVLLLDEADVFLERRTMADMHRNALVSIFLRVLEYFQGILFLTTNRVETFDDAFQSRIHVALRYNELGFKAKVKIWKMFLEMVRVKYGDDAPEVLTNDEVEWLAKRKLNGRQIKNSVRTAQALANNKNETLSLKHIKTVLDVAEGFENDLKGTGQLDSMHAYA